MTWDLPVQIRDSKGGLWTEREEKGTTNLAGKIRPTGLWSLQINTSPVQKPSHYCKPVTLELIHTHSIEHTSVCSGCWQQWLIHQNNDISAWWFGMIWPSSSEAQGFQTWPSASHAPGKERQRCEIVQRMSKLEKCTTRQLDTIGILYDSIWRYIYI